MHALAFTDYIPLYHGQIGSLMCEPWTYCVDNSSELFDIWINDVRIKRWRCFRKSTFSIFFQNSLLSEIYR